MERIIPWLSHILWTMKNVPNHQNQLRYFWASLWTWSIPHPTCRCRDAPGDVRFQGPKSRQSPGAPATDSTDFADAILGRKNRQNTWSGWRDNFNRKTPWSSWENHHGFRCRFSLKNQSSEQNTWENPWKLDGFKRYLENTHLKLWKTTTVIPSQWFLMISRKNLLHCFWHPLCSSYESVCHKHRSLLLCFALCICAWQHIHECIASS